MQLYDAVARFVAGGDGNLSVSLKVGEEALSQSQVEELKKLKISNLHIPTKVVKYRRCTFFGMHFAAATKAHKRDCYIAVDTDLIKVNGEACRFYGEIQFFTTLLLGEFGQRTLFLAYVEWFQMLNLNSGEILRKFVADPMLNRWVKMSEIVCRVALLPCPGRSQKHTVLELL